MKGNGGKGAKARRKNDFIPSPQRIITSNVEKLATPRMHKAHTRRGKSSGKSFAYLFFPPSPLPVEKCNSPRLATSRTPELRVKSARKPSHRAAATSRRPRERGIERIKCMRDENGEKYWIPRALVSRLIQKTLRIYRSGKIETCISFTSFSSTRSLYVWFIRRVVENANALPPSRVK